jgi:hypothetical protein
MSVAGVQAEWRMLIWAVNKARSNDRFEIQWKRMSCSWNDPFQMYKTAVSHKLTTRNTQVEVRGKQKIGVKCCAQDKSSVTMEGKRRI